MFDIHWLMAAYDENNGGAISALSDRIDARCSGLPGRAKSAAGYSG
jgi:hypothetical protein